MLVKTNTHTINGAKAIIETLKKLSVDTVFGYPGGIVLELYDELYKQSEIKHILVRHEQFAVHSAEGYARESGKCGIVFVTAGPGATNTITGIANAYLDSYPIIIFAGAVSKKYTGEDEYQEVDICEMTKTCTKATFKITKANQIENTILKAHEVAMADKKGPVVIEVVKDIFSEITEINEDLNYTESKVQSFSDSDIENLYQKISNSDKPVIVAGGGVIHADAYEELESFAVKHKIPVVCSMMGMGSYNKDNENYFGMIGINGDNCANELIKQADLIISFGCRFNSRISCVFEGYDIFSKIVSVDINASNRFKSHIEGDIKNVLYKLCTNNNKIRDYSYWLKKAQNFKSLNKPAKKSSNMLHGFEVLQKLNDYTKSENIIFTSDVGQHQVLAVKNLSLSKKRKIFVSGGSGTMGFGFPAAIGCAIANPNACVVCITGDGSFQMSLNELALCSDLGLNIKVIILNNGYLGMVRQLQETNCAGRYSQTKISNPDFVKLAQSYGVEGLRVNSITDVNKAFEFAFSEKNTFILDFDIESSEIV